MQHGHRMPFVGQVELVVREEDRHAADAALPRAGNGPLDLVQHRVHFIVGVLPAEVRCGAVDALHRAADARPHRERVRRRVERLAACRPAEAEVVGADSLRLSLLDKSRGLAPGRVGTEHGHGFLARADDAVLDVEVLKALLGTRGEPGSSRDEHRFRCGLSQYPAKLADLR